MSHYSVMVIGENVDEQLQPYQEFECTGIDDQYVQEIDMTEEVRKEYNEHKETHFKDPDGNLHAQFTPEGDWDQKFWRELTSEEEALYGGKRSFHQDHDANPQHGGLRLYSTDWKDGKPYHTKAFAWPSEGWSEVEVPTNTVQTLAEFIEHWNCHKPIKIDDMPDLEGKHKYGYVVVDENGEVVKDVDRTNPQRKWDWWKIGGRWIGYFKLKEEAVGRLGEPGINSMDPDYKTPDAGRADQCRKSDIDVEGMRFEAAEEAAKNFDLFVTVTSESFIDPDPPHRRIQIEGEPKPGMPRHLSWKQVQDKHRTGEGENDVDYDAARKEYGNQIAVKALRANKETIWFEADNFLCTREEFIERASRKALATFAVVKDSRWYERGEMGWWGVVHDEKDNDEWLNQFSALIDGLPDDTLLTVVDCHI